MSQDKEKDGFVDVAVPYAVPKDSKWKFLAHLPGSTQLYQREDGVQVVVLAGKVIRTRENPPLR